MTNQEMLTLVKMRGWRLRSRRGWPDTRKRSWRVEDEKGVITVTPRPTQGLALQWAIALITDDEEKQGMLRIVELHDELINKFDEWKKDNRR